MPADWKCTDPTQAMRINHIKVIQGILIGALCVLAACEILKRVGIL